MNENCIFQRHHDHHSVMDYKHRNTGVFSQEYYDFYVETVKRATRNATRPWRSAGCISAEAWRRAITAAHIFTGKMWDNEGDSGGMPERGRKGGGCALQLGPPTPRCWTRKIRCSRRIMGAVCNELYRLRGYYPAMIVGAAGIAATGRGGRGRTTRSLNGWPPALQKINEISCDTPLDLHFEGNVW